MRCDEDRSVAALREDCAPFPCWELGLSSASLRSNQALSQPDGRRSLCPHPHPLSQSHYRLPVVTYMGPAGTKYVWGKIYKVPQNCSLVPFRSSNSWDISWWGCLVSLCFVYFNGGFVLCVHMYCVHVSAHSCGTLSVCRTEGSQPRVLFPGYQVPCSDTHSLIHMELTK